jgi:hypothetical protein
VLLDNATANTIGGTSVGARNVISGNTGSGVRMTGTGTPPNYAYANLLLGNYIGTNAAGTAAVGNREGVLVDPGSFSNLIGDDVSGAGNVISGNRAAGVKLASDNGAEVLGNFIGTNAAGTGAIANAEDGVFINAQGNSVGWTFNGNSLASRNVISGNAQSGIEIAGANANQNVVANNYIGTDVTGTLDLGNNLNGVIVTARFNNILW